MEATWPIGRVLALIELIVCVIPPTFLWMLMTPGMLILMTAGVWFERGEVGVSTLAAVWWVGGGLGLHALWHLTMRDLGDEGTSAPPRWRRSFCFCSGHRAIFRSSCPPGCRSSPCSRFPPRCGRC